MTEKKASRPLAPQGEAVKQMEPESEADFKKLHYFLDTYFDLREQDDLCKVLRIVSPQVSGQTKKSRAADIIKKVVEADRLTSLIAFMSQVRPFYADDIAQLNLPDHVADYSLDFINDAELPLVRSVQLAEQLADQLKAKALPELCFDLEVDFENLGGISHLEHVQNLVAIMESRDELDRLLMNLNERWPSVQWLAGE